MSATPASDHASTLRGLAGGVFRGLHEAEALEAGAAALEAAARPAPKVLAEAWAVVGEDGKITTEFVRADDIYPLSVLEDADDAARSLGDNQCGRIVRVQVVEVPS